MKFEQKIYKNEFDTFYNHFRFSQKETKPPSKQCKKRQVVRNPVGKTFIITREVIMGSTK